MNFMLDCATGRNHKSYLPYKKDKKTLFLTRHAQKVLHSPPMMTEQFTIKIKIMKQYIPIQIIHMSHVCMEMCRETEKETLVQYCFKYSFLTGHQN